MYSDKNTQTKRGIRCTVCTGCGRCPGGEGVKVLTRRMLPFTVNLRNDRNERLITADVGTTTIAMQLHREDGSVEDSFAAVNPQTVYGADVISRIAAAGAGNAAGKSEPAECMKRMVREILEKGIRRFRKRISAEENLKMVLAANTTMVYLLMGWNPEELGRAPFTATHLEETETRIADVPCFIMPGLSAFVGGDITAGIYACGIPDAQKPRLLVDLGTNGEIVLGNRDRILVSSTAAGPAFEGGVNRGVWGADMVKLLATLRRENLMDETGLLADKYFDTGIRIGDVCVTQESVRAVQLAKAAIAAGIEILLEQYGCVYDEVEQVIIAGGFGYYLNPQDAMEIGLLPEALAGKAVAGGNTALAGALYIGNRLLRENGAENRNEEVAVDIRKKKNPAVEVINLATQPEFEKIYLKYMAFARIPHFVK